MIAKNRFAGRLNSLLAVALFFPLVTLSVWAGGRGDTRGIDDVETPYTVAESTKPLPMNYSNDVKNVILLIGDGMGLVQAQSTRFSQLGPEGRLHFEHFPVTGLMDVYSADKLITDSAGSVTALACGVKTVNGRIGMTPDATIVKNVREAAQEKGMATGIVATSAITHATPAGFTSHVLQRSQMVDIAEQMAGCGADVMLGGGWKFFVPEDEDGKRTDGRNLLEEMKEAGYQVLLTKDELDEADDKSKMIGLFQAGYLMTVRPEPTLAEMTAKALDVLEEDPDGFFLMVEGSQIDWGGHDNNFDYMLRQVLLFDDAVRVATEFAQTHPGTLVIVTADHETGGLEIKEGERDGSDLNPNWASGSHTAQGVPVYAFGPGSLTFTGVFDNTDIAKRIAALLSLEGLPQP